MKGNTDNRLVFQSQFERKIILAGHPADAFDYFSDPKNFIGLFPGVERVMHFKDGRYRMVVAAEKQYGIEAGLLLDIRFEFEGKDIVKVVPLEVSSEVAAELKPAHMTMLVPGLFGSDFHFVQHGSQTEVSHQLKLVIDFEMPGILKMIPKKMLENTGQSIMQKKMQQISENFANNLVADFEEWSKRREAMPMTA